MGRIVATLAALIALSTSATSADWPTSRLGDLAVWDAAYDAVTGIRFIPTQLVVPAVWDGSRRLDMPATSFMQPSETYWHGPVAWRNPYGGETIQVYDRRRSNKREGDVLQKMALRREGDGIGRVYDSRFGGLVCSDEVKFPVGAWRQGEVRRFDYDCFTTEGGKPAVRRRASIITVEAVDYVCGGVPHCFSYRWRHIDAETNEVLDHRNYIFVPGRGLSGEARVQ
jgi:hypothetical protein